MRVVMFYHSLISDWNHGNAHFLRGIASELLSRGHEVQVWEPADAWSVRNLELESGPEALEAYRSAYPMLASIRYERETFSPAEALRSADVVLVHEWNDAELIAAIGAYRRGNPHFLLFFHDTHHRAVTNPGEMARFDLSGYDGVLAFGESLSRRYRQTHPQLPAWTWHEAADTRVFRPMPGSTVEQDLVWVGNWGDDERTQELHEFLLRPVRELGLRATVYGVRYPKEALAALEAHGIRYGGWLPNYRAPDVFSRALVTVHVPRRPYTQALPGIPTIRVFEALACGIPLLSAPWPDEEGLFTAGSDYLVAHDGREMAWRLWELVDRADRRQELASNGLCAISRRHTCAHRVNELMEIVNQC